jgi:hypothetical protein
MAEYTGSARMYDSLMRWALDGNPDYIPWPSDLPSFNFTPWWKFSNSLFSREYRLKLAEWAGEIKEFSKWNNYITYRISMIKR